MVIVEAGSVIHEWYRDGDASFARDIASAQKSVLSLLVGRAIDEGLLLLESTIDSVLGTGWATGDSGTVTVAHLLTMTSGLDDSLAWSINLAGHGATTTPSRPSSMSSSR